MIQAVWDGIAHYANAIGRPRARWIPPPDLWRAMDELEHALTILEQWQEQAHKLRLALEANPDANAVGAMTEQMTTQREFLRRYESALQEVLGITELTLARPKVGTLVNNMEVIRDIVRGILGRTNERAGDADHR